MNKFNFTYFARYLVAFMVFFSGVSMAETALIFPVTHNTCLPEESAPTSNGIAAVSNYGNGIYVKTSQSLINGKITLGTTFSGVLMSLNSIVTALGAYNLSSSKNRLTIIGSGTFTELGDQLVQFTAYRSPTVTEASTRSTNSQSAGSLSTNAATSQTSSYSCDGCTTFEDVINATTEKKWMDKKNGVCRAATTTDNAALYGYLAPPSRTYKKEFYSLYPNTRWVKICNESH